MEAFWFSWWRIGTNLFKCLCNFKLPDKFRDFYINNIPGSSEVHRANYDLSFSLTFTNKYINNDKTYIHSYYIWYWLTYWLKGTWQKEGEWTLPRLFSHELIRSSIINKSTRLWSL
ncbi:hypothetical protein MPNC_5862 [Mycoplasmoides pneumoniae]|uniref:Uncharacterized protein n=1 Tax=Mycoplasmoides pneumoniae 309 TaxID=1112856 RepID=A0AB33HPD2_MYCPM|nr:hypothetical protein MPNA5862 [Mycoplasmoides pneumoniae 309]BAV20834.1 hypothetical protein MPNC_5862 [Mycoplasmoides pneumoniae]